MRPQASLARPVPLQGRGLHSGEQVRLLIEPAPAQHGLVFLRRDLPAPQPIPARADCVVDTRLATTLGRGDQRVATVEHLLAAMSAVELDNALVVVWGPELPAFDGSALPWVKALMSGGRVQQGAGRAPIAPVAPLELRRGSSWARVLPASRLSLRATIRFPHPQLLSRTLDYHPGPQAFQSQLAWARTFALEDQVVAMRSQGLARGGSLHNAVVLDGRGVLNPSGLRGTDEPLRHKLVDLRGDLSLLGAPLQARIEVQQPGHGFNLALVRAILRAQTPG